MANSKVLLAFGALSKKFPKQLGSFQASLDATTAAGEATNQVRSVLPLEQLRSNIHRQRVEYYLRTYQRFVQRQAHAKTEFKNLVTWAKNPSQWVYGDLVAAGVIGVQIVGLFALGEAWGRSNFFGYPTGDEAHH